MTISEMTEENYIYAYYQKIQDGSIVVGKWIRLLYEHFIQGFHDKEFFFDQKRANHAIDWIETHCFHTEGRLATKPLKLELWQKAFLSAVFGIVDEKGNRLGREVFLVVARKNGKSALASAVCNYVWRECGGYGAKVYCIAPKLEQADIVYGNIWQMVQLDPEWQALKEICQEKDEHNKKVNDDSMLARKRVSDLYIPGINSSVKKLPFTNKRSDGFSPDLTVCDEVASWEGDKGLKQYEVMRSGMGAKAETGSFILSVTTSGYVNDSIYDELMKRSTRFLLGDSKEKRLMPFLYMIDDIDRWNDINELRKANPNLGVSVSVDYILEEINVAEGSLSKRSEFICKMACLKQNSSTAWLPSKVVEAASGEHIGLEDLRDSYAVVGIDLSQTTDLTCACVVVEKNGELYVVSQFFMPSEKIEEAAQRDGVPYNLYIQRGLLTPSGDNFVDYHDVFKWCTDLVETWQLLPLRVGYDRYSAQYLVKELEQYGFVTDDVFQGENLYPVLLECQGLLEDKRLHIGDNDLLKMHLLDTAIKMSVERGRGRMVKVSPGVHIDGAAALIDALCVRQKWYSEIGDQLKN